MSEAAVTACYQHSIATTVHHMAGAAAGNQLGKDKDQGGRDGDNADDLAEGVNVVHAAEVLVNHCA